MIRRFLTSGDPARIGAQYDNGVTVRVIAENLKISERTIYRVLKARGTAYRRPTMTEGGIDPETIEKAEDLVRQGSTIKDAAAAVGISAETYTHRSAVRPTPEQAKANRSRAQRERHARARTQKETP